MEAITQIVSKEIQLQMTTKSLINRGLMEQAELYKKQCHDVLIVTHSNCFDGEGARTILTHLLPDAQSCSIRAGETKFCEILAEKTKDMKLPKMVILADICPNDVLQAEQMVDVLICLDHHYTQSELVLQLKHGVYRTKSSGVILAYELWDSLNGRFPKDAICKSIIDALYLHDNGHFESLEMWKIYCWWNKMQNELYMDQVARTILEELLFGEPSAKRIKLFHHVLELGEKEYNLQLERAKKSIETEKSIYFDGQWFHCVQLIDDPVLGIISGHYYRLWKENEQYKTMGLMVWRIYDSKEHPDGYLYVGMRGHPDSDLDFTPIARLHGGGGHKTACAFNEYTIHNEEDARKFLFKMEVH